MDDIIHVTKICSGRYFDLGLTTTGKVIVIGHLSLSPNYYGYEELVSSLALVDNIVDLAISWEHIFLVKSNGSVMTFFEYLPEDQWRYGELVFKTIPEITDVVAVYASPCRVFFLTRDHKILGWGIKGNNLHGSKYGLQLGWRYPNGKIKTLRCLKRVAEISCSYNHVLALLNNNRVMVWGNNDYGKLGLGDDRNRKCPKLLKIKNVKSIACNSVSSIFLCCDGKLFYSGYSRFYEQKYIPTLIENIVPMISCHVTEKYLLAISENKSLYCLGQCFELNIATNSMIKVCGYEDIEYVHCGDRLFIAHPCSTIMIDPEFSYSCELILDTVVLHKIPKTYLLNNVYYHKFGILMKNSNSTI